MEKLGIVIGYDRRFLSKEAAKWAAETMASQGIPCLLLIGRHPLPCYVYS